MTQDHPYRRPSADLSNAVRSIRMAAALNERFGTVAKKTSYSSREELSNALGEARQLFPEIWSLLDSARGELANRGIDVAAYDRLRALDATRDAGVVSVDVVESAGAMLGGGVLKSAQLNHEGHAAATEACSVLRGALPQIDWEALDRAEAEEIAAMGTLGPALWKKIVFGVIAIVVAAVLIAALMFMRMSAGR